MFNFSKFFISLFFIGTIPYAPGTFGSFFTLIFFYSIIDSMNAISLVLIFFIIFLISLFLINYYSKKTETHDDKKIVIDEFLGILFILIFYHYYQFTNNLFMFIIIFLLFRFFDILKPFPINWIDNNFKNSLSVILDDVIAGLYTLIILYLFYAFL